MLTDAQASAWPYSPSPSLIPRPTSSHTSSPSSSPIPSPHPNLHPNLHPSPHPRPHPSPHPPQETDAAFGPPPTDAATWAAYANTARPHVAATPAAENWADQVSPAWAAATPAAESLADRAYQAWAAAIPAAARWASPASLVSAADLRDSRDSACAYSHPESNSRCYAARWECQPPDPQRRWLRPPDPPCTHPCTVRTPPQSPPRAAS